jgi:hypothetical protein
MNGVASSTLGSSASCCSPVHSRMRSRTQYLTSLRRVVLRHHSSVRHTSMAPQTLHSEDSWSTLRSIIGMTITCQSYTPKETKLPSCRSTRALPSPYCSGSSNLKLRKMPTTQPKWKEHASITSTEKSLATRPCSSGSLAPSILKGMQHPIEIPMRTRADSRITISQNRLVAQATRLYRTHQHCLFLLHWSLEGNLSLDHAA